MTATVRYVAEDGRGLRELPLAREDLVGGYRAMRRAGHFDGRPVTLERQGRPGVHPLSRGRAAAQLGASLALEPHDWLVPAHRESAAAITHGLPLETALLFCR